MTIPTNPRRNTATSFRRIGSEGGLVVIPGRAEVKVLNPVAIHVYALLDGTRSVDDLVAAVTSEFEISADEARRDVLEFLEQLGQHGMLAPAEDPAETR